MQRESNLLIYAKVLVLIQLMQRHYEFGVETD